jgi:hypothetical protein
MTSHFIECFKVWHTFTSRIYDSLFSGVFGIEQSLCSSPFIQFYNQEESRRQIMQRDYLSNFDIFGPTFKLHFRLNTFVLIEIWGKQMLPNFILILYKNFNFEFQFRRSESSFWKSGETVVTNMRVKKGLSWRTAFILMIGELALS